MEQLKAYEMLLNNQVIGIIATGTVILTVLFFLWLYYFYIEQTSLARVVTYYFGAAFLGLFADSMIAFGRINSRYALPLDFFEGLLVVAELLTLYCFYLFFHHLLRYWKESEKIFIFILIPIFTLLYSLVGYRGPILSFYIFIITVTTCFSAYKLKRKSLISSSVGTFFFCIIIYNGTLWTMPILELQWILDILVVIGLIVYFMYRYKCIINEKERLLKRLKIDGLTGAVSKGEFLGQLATCEKGCVLFIDINKFKIINDKYGHLVGDQLLKMFVLNIKKNTQGLLSRFGGDEFTYLIGEKDVKLLESEIFNIQEAFKSSVNEMDLDGVDALGISIGVSKFSDFKGLEAIEAADAAMYEAKGIGNYEYREGKVF